MTVTPWWMLAGVMAAVAVIILADRQVSRRRAKRLQRLAERCGFRYSSVDRFELAGRIHDALPATAGDVLVRDLMYRREPDGYAYAFTAVYTAAGRTLRVVHARERAGASRLCDVCVADAALPLGEQYRRLLHETDAA